MPIVTLSDGTRIDTGSIKGETGTSAGTITPKPSGKTVKYIVRRGGGGGRGSRKTITPKNGEGLVIEDDGTTISERELTKDEQLERQNEQINPRVALVDRYNRLRRERLEQEQRINQSQNINQDPDISYLRRVPEPTQERPEGFGLGGSLLVAGMGRGLITKNDRRTVKVSASKDFRDIKKGQQVILTEDKPKFQIRKDKVVTSLSLMPELIKEKTNFRVIDKKGAITKDTLVATSTDVNIKYGGVTVGKTKIKYSKDQINRQIILNELAGNSKSFTKGFALNIKQNVGESIKNFGISATLGTVYQGIKTGVKRKLLKKGKGRLIGRLTPYGALAETSFFVGAGGGLVYIEKKRSINKAEMGYNLAQPIISALGFATGVGAVSKVETKYTKSILKPKTTIKYDGRVSYKYKQSLHYKQTPANVKIDNIKGTFRTKSTSGVQTMTPIKYNVINLKGKGKGFKQNVIIKGNKQYSTSIKTVGKNKYTILSKTDINTGKTFTKIFKNNDLVIQNKYTSKNNFMNFKGKLKIGNKKTFEINQPGKILKATSQKQTRSNLGLSKDLTFETKQRTYLRKELLARVKSDNINIKTETVIDLDKGISKQNIKSFEKVKPKLEFSKKGSESYSNLDFNKGQYNIKGTYASLQNVKLNTRITGKLKYSKSRTFKTLLKHKGAKLNTKLKERVIIRDRTKNNFKLRMPSNRLSNVVNIFNPKLKTRGILTTANKPRSNTLNKINTNYNVRLSKSIKSTPVNHQLKIPTSKTNTKQNLKIDLDYNITPKSKPNLGVFRTINGGGGVNIKIPSPPPFFPGLPGIGGFGYAGSSKRNRRGNRSKNKVNIKPTLIGSFFNSGIKINPIKTYSGFGVRRK